MKVRETNCLSIKFPSIKISSKDSYKDNRIIQMFRDKQISIVRINVTRDSCRKQRKEMAKVHYNAVSLYRSEISRNNTSNNFLDP